MDARLGRTREPGAPGPTTNLSALIVPARLAPQPRARRQSRRNAHARNHRQQQSRRPALAVADADVRGAVRRLRLTEGPDRLIPVRGADVDADAGARAVGVGLVVERDRELD